MIASALLLGLTLAGQADDPSRVAVRPLEGPAPDALRAEVGGLVRAEVTRLFPSSVLDVDTTAAELATAEQMGFQCAPDDTDCLTRLAIFLRTELLVSGILEGDEHAAQLRLFVVSASSAARLNEVTEAIPPPGPARLQAVRSAVGLLLTPEKMLGSLAVAAPPGARLFLDGEEIGEAPLAAPLSGIKVGRHTVRAELEGYAPAERVVEVFAGSEAAADLELSPTAGESPDEELALADDAPAVVDKGSTLGLSLLIAGGVGLVLGGGVTLAAVGATAAAEAILSLSEVGDHPTRQLIQTAGRGFAVVGLVALVVVVSGGISAGAGWAIGGAE